MRIIHVVYSGAKCRATSNAVSEQIRTLRAEFSFSEDWDAYPERTAVFISGTRKELAILDENNSCEVPASVSEAGYLQVGAFAIAKDSSGEIMRYPGEYARVCLGQGASPDGSAEPSEDEASVYEEMLVEMWEAAEAANAAAAFAEENGEDAWNQACYANQEATNAYDAAESARDATWRAREAGQRASEAATLASMNSDFAREAGRYAYGIIGNLYRDAVLPFTEAEISETGESSGFVTNPDFYNTGKTYFRYKTDNGVSFKWTNPRPEKGSLKITMCAYGQYEEHFTSSMNVHYTDGTKDSFEFTHGVTVVYDTDKTKTVESMTGGPYVSDYGYQPWILLDMDVMSIIASYLIPQSDWLAEEGEAGHVLNRTHYYERLYPDSIFPVEINPKELGEGIYPVITTNNPATFSSTFRYDLMLTDPRLIETYTLDYGVDTQDRSNSGFNFVSKFKLFDDKNYSLAGEGGLTVYVVVDTSILSEEYKAMFPEVGVYVKAINNSPVVKYALKLVKFSVTLPEQFIPNMFPRVHGKAEVGQVLQVEKTDYFGNPTKWKAVDIPEGGGGSGGGIVEIANNADVSAVSSFSYTKDIDGNPLKVNDFWIVLDAPNNSKDQAWLELYVNGFRLINIMYYRNKQINLHTVIHKNYCEHTMYFSTRHAENGGYGYVAYPNDDDDAIRFIGPVGSDFTNAEKTIKLTFNYGINDPAWGENARLWVWGE